jgi:hypothetical protein
MSHHFWIKLVSNTYTNNLLNFFVNLFRWNFSSSLIQIVFLPKISMISQPKMCFLAYFNFVNVRQFSEKQANAMHILHMWETWLYMLHTSCPRNFGFFSTQNQIQSTLDCRYLTLTKTIFSDTILGICYVSSVIHITILG